MTAPFTDAEMGLNPPNRFWDPQVLADTCNALRARLREAERQRDEARAALVWRPTHRHRKRGSVYQRERDNVEIQTSRPIVEGDIISVYVGKDGKPWGRLNEEFEDGRFEALSALPPPATSATEGE